MQVAPTDIAEAFPICNVKVFRESENDFEWFSVIRIEGDSIHLQSRLQSAECKPPEPDERLRIESAAGDVLFRMAIRVVKATTNDHIVIISRREGKIERIERRNKHRLFLTLPVRIRRDSRTAEEPISLETQDINSLGMRLCMPDEVALAESLTIDIIIPDELPPPTCRGTVVRCRRLDNGLFEVGVLFRQLDEQVTERIADTFLRQLFNA